MYGDPNKDKKFEVWNAMHGIIQAIDENRIDSETIISLVSACNLVVRTEELGWGVQLIHHERWAYLIKINEETGLGFDEMVDTGLEYYFQNEPLEIYSEDSED